MVARPGAEDRMEPAGEEARVPPPRACAAEVAAVPITMPMTSNARKKPVIPGTVTQRVLNWLEELKARIMSSASSQGEERRGETRKAVVT
jgi:hypothetical protein